MDGISLGNLGREFPIVYAREIRGRRRGLSRMTVDASPLHSCRHEIYFLKNI